MWTLRNARNTLGAVVRAALKYRRPRTEAARGAFVDHLLAFPGTIERARAAARTLNFMGFGTPPGNLRERDHG